MKAFINFSNKTLALIGLVMLFSGSPAFSMDMGLGIGLRMNDAKSKTTNQSVDGTNSFQFGGLIYSPLSGKFELRTGFMYTERKYEVGITDVKLTYVDVPLTFMYKMADYGGVFFGIDAALKVSDDCGGSDCTDAKSFVTPVTFGGSFKVAPQIALELFYEMISGDLYNNLKDATAVGANAVITFD